MMACTTVPAGEKMSIVTQKNRSQPSTPFRIFCMLRLACHKIVPNALVAGIELLLEIQIRK